MKTSVIRHPDNNVFVIRREWQLQMLATPRKGSVAPKRDNSTECGAEILSVIEYHHNNRMANKILRQQIDMLAMAGSGDLEKLGDWMPYSLHYFQELLLNGRSIGLIRSGLDLLLERKVISGNPPADILKSFNSTYTWLKLEVDLINDWIDTNCPKGWVDGWKKPRRKAIHPNIQTDEEAVGSPAIDTNAKIVNTVCRYYVHVHNKNANFVIDSNRQKGLKARVKEPNRNLGMFAQAVIGNVLSDFHQGNHPENDLTKGGKLYDDIELIFRNAKNFENHVRMAEEKGVTAEVAMSDLEAFIAGTPSKYVKKNTKTSQNAPDRQQSASVPAPTNAKQYREFAQAISSFFHTNVSNPEIMEFCKTQPELVRLGKGVTDPVYLATMIDTGIRTFRPTGATAEMMKQITDFAAAFCKIQILNEETEDEYGEAF